MKKIIFFGVFSALFLMGCNPDSPENPPEIKVKAVSETGTLEKKPLNIFEDGTHYLQKKDGEKILLKSSVVDLSDFENRTIIITGEQKDIPKSPIEVFQVDVERAPIDERPARYQEKDFSLSLELPASWSRKRENKILSFSPENSDPAIIISSEINSPKKRAELALGRTISLGKRTATKITTGDEIDIFVPTSQKNTLLRFHFSPQRNPEMEKLVFFEMLSGVEWLDTLPENSETEEEIISCDGTKDRGTEEAQCPIGFHCEQKDSEELGTCISDELPSKSPETVTEVTKEEPVFCGGIAKKLCPTGFRCDLESFEPDASGICIDAQIPPKSLDIVIDEKENQIIETEASEKPTESTKAPEGFLEYENERFGYHFSLPKSWHWQHIGAEGGDLSVLQITQEESFEEITAEIRIKKGAKTAEESTKEGKIVIIRPRDAMTFFEVSGKEENASQIRTIATSLSF